MKADEPTRGDELVQQILNHGDDGNASNELLGEIFDGYPATSILPLLQSSDDDITKAGAFIAEELGDKARPLIPELSRLLNHSNARVRSDVLDAVLLAATPGDGQAIADAIGLVNDSDQEVRRKAFELVAHGDRVQLDAAVPFLSNELLARHIAWLLGVEASADSDFDVEAKLGNEDPLVRWFAVVAAVRIWQRNPGPLSMAVDSAAGDLAAFAISSSHRLEKARSRAERRERRARESG